MIRISRLTPPPRDTLAIPGMASSRLLIVLSMYQLSCSSPIAVDSTAM